MNTAIIVAAGSGSRFASSVSKQFVQLHGKPLIFRTLEPFGACPAIDEIILVLSEEGREQFVASQSEYELNKLRSIVIGANTRAGSVRNGLAAIDPSTANIVAIHDGARPLVTVDEITRTVAKADETGAACLVAEVTDTIKQVDGTDIIGTIDRSGLRRALTPQAFRYDVIMRAFSESNLDENATDESSIVERMRIKVSLVEGSSRNIKITRPEDLVLAEALARGAQMSFRIGFGTDIHRLVAGRPLIIGGVKIESDLGADGHSDADVLMHAVADAVLGSLALGDLGTHFPNDEERWKNAESSQFVRYAVGLVKERGYEISNLDSVVDLERPKLRPHIESMRANLAAALDIDIAHVSVKAKTGERVDAVGESRAVRAEAVVLVMKTGK